MVVSIYPSYDAVNNNLHIELTVNKKRTKQCELPKNLESSQKPGLRADKNG